MAGSPALPDAEAIYVRDGAHVVPTERARGPWDPRAQHGGAPAALLASVLERLPVPGAASAPLRVARLTVELLRPVPLAPLAVSASVLRPGLRVALVEAELADAAGPVARATALRIRRAEGAVPEVAPAGATPAASRPGPQAAAGPPGAEAPTFGSDGMEIRFAAGAFEHPGPAVAWMRLRVPLVAGEHTSPFARAAAVADFGNGISAALPWAQYVFINPDLTVYLDREPAGEWLAIASETTVRADGTGRTDSVLSDGDGPVGRATQALYVARRD